MHHAFTPDSLIEAAEWLSEIFSAPLAPSRLAELSSPANQQALHQLGVQLAATAITAKLGKLLAQESPEELAIHLQRRYTALFEGVFRHQAVLPYESAWKQAGIKPLTDMDETLRQLDLRLSVNHCERPDHLTIELAALAIALRDGNNTIAMDLSKRLRDWVPDFHAALQQQDAGGFYATAARLLLALIDQSSTTLAMHTQAAAYNTTCNVGDSP